MKNWFLLAAGFSFFIRSVAANTLQDADLSLSKHEKSQEIAALDSSFAVQSPISFSMQEPIYQPKRVNANLAAVLSMICPGLGHAYLKDVSMAGYLFGSSSLAVYAAIKEIGNTDVSFGLNIAQNTWSYGIYSAYRDARIANGLTGYSYKMPTDSFFDLATAPFRPSVLKKPEVWGGVLGALAVAFTTAYVVESIEGRIPSPAASSRGPLFPMMALPVGVGEEALFRGYLQTQFCEMFRPEIGITLSSLSFGAAHIPNAQALEKNRRWTYYSFSLPLITSLGAYLGWLTHKNGSLKESVAVHTLYDMALFSLAALADEEACIFKDTGFMLTLPF